MSLDIPTARRNLAEIKWTEHGLRTAEKTGDILRYTQMAFDALPEEEQSQIEAASIQNIEELRTAILQSYVQAMQPKIARLENEAVVERLEKFERYKSVLDDAQKRLEELSETDNVKALGKIFLSIVSQIPIAQKSVEAANVRRYLEAGQADHAKTEITSIVAKLKEGVDKELAA